MTFFITRINAHLFHDYKNYGTSKEKSKTLTGVLRKLTKKDIHHFHIGVLILIFALILIFDISNFNILFLGIGISLIADQIVPIFIKNKNYFKKEQILISILNHLIVLILSFFIFSY